MQGGLGPKIPCNTFGFVHFNHLRISHWSAGSVRYFHAPPYVGENLNIQYVYAPDSAYFHMANT